MRILIVEDEAPLADTIAQGLHADGFDCDLSHDGLDGLWRATEGTYAAIVLDLLLPGLNGFGVCRRLRAEENWTPVLILTAKVGDYDLVEALECGADDFLSKPFSFAVLAARLRALIRRGSVPRPPLLSCGSLELDPFTHRCERRGHSISLTPREAAVLRVLLASGGGVVSKSELLDAVWGAGFDGDPHIIDVYLSHLRQKVDQPFGVTTVETVRGVGYRVVPDA